MLQVDIKEKSVKLPVGFPLKITYDCEPSGAWNFHSSRAAAPKSPE